MKVSLLVLSIITFGFGALAQTSNTEANWFSPSCQDCFKMLTPGTANLGNKKGVFRPGSPGSKTKKKSTTTPPVKTGQ